MYLTLIISYSIFTIGNCLMFVQQSILTIPSSYPIGSSIYHVIVIDEVTGSRPNNVRFNITGTKIINCSPKNKKLYDSLFGVDTKIGTLLLSPHQTVSLQEFAGCTIALHIEALSSNPTRRAILTLPITILEDNQTELQDGTTCEPKLERCFGPFEYVYYVPESTKPGTVVGNIKPLGHIKSCSGFRNKYSIDSQMILPPVDASSGELKLLQVLDYEIEREFNFTISCESNFDVENSTVNAIFTRDATLRVVDVNDNAPYLQPGAKADIELDVDDIAPGKKLPANFNVLDNDSRKVNDIKVQLKDPRHLFMKKNTAVFETIDYIFVNTEIFAIKNFSFEGEVYSFSVVFRDKSLINATENQQVVYHVSIYNRTSSHPVELPKDFIVMANISVHASQHARVVQPIDIKESDGYLFQLISYENTTDSQQVFGVTPRTGIIYLKDEQLLTTNTNHTYHMLLLWNYRKSSDFECNVIIKVIEIGSPPITCDEKLLTCARHKEESSCTGSCGRAAVDGTCQWRTGRNTTKPTTLYPACSPQLATCPDGKCDEIEAMDANICPQDCTTIITGAGFFPHSERGVSAAASPCSCNRESCTCVPEYGNYRTDRVKRKKMNTTSEVHTYIERESCDAGCVAVVASVAIVVSTLAFVGLLFIMRQVKRVQIDKHRYVANRVPLNAVVSDYVDDRTVPNGITDSPREMPHEKPYFNSKWEFRRDRLIFQETLGEGEFGKVVKAQAWNIAQKPGYTTVAVKTIKENGTSAEEQDLLSELSLLREVSHPNVIQLLGACTTKGGPLYVIVEYAEIGSLRTYLRRIRQHNRTAAMDNPSYFESGHENCHLYGTQSDFNIKQELLSFSWQIAKGMAYLSEMKLVHRDLAARNVLLTQNKVIKISDFGLSRDVYLGDTYLKTTKGRVPVKWMALESLEDHIYTTKSDVWSYGIVLWEIVNLGATPYPGITPERLYHLLKEGYRMPQPENCSSKIYKIMRKCWKNTPQERPSFKELVEKLDKLLQDTVEYLPLGTDDFSTLLSQYECPIVRNQNSITEPKEVSMDEPSSRISNNYRTPYWRYGEASTSGYENGHLLRPSQDETNQEVAL